MMKLVQPRSQPGSVHRLTFEYEGDQIRLVSDQIVTMVVPASHPLEAIGTQAGFSAVLRDAQERPLYQFTRTSPIRHDAEVFSDDGSGTISRVTVDRPRGSFVMLVPALEGAVSVELAGQPLAPQTHLQAPRTLAKFALRR